MFYVLMSDINTRLAGMLLFGLSSRGMPFNWGLGGDVASIGLPQSKASPPMLISQGQEEPLQCFSFEGGLEKYNNRNPAVKEERGKNKHADSIALHLSVC